MYVPGLSSRRSPVALATLAVELALAGERRAEPRRRARRRTRSPRCGACASYSRPGLPRPTTSRIERQADERRWRRCSASVRASPATARRASEKGPPAASRRALARGTTANDAYFFLSSLPRLPSSRRLRRLRLGRGAPAAAAAAAASVGRGGFLGSRPAPAARRPSRPPGRACRARRRVTPGGSLQRRHVDRVADVERRTGRPR